MDFRTVGPYRIVDHVGSGGMGDVYLAEDPRLDRKVALKRPSETQLRSPEARQRFLREARAAATLNHPGIAAVYDVIETEESPYIVMEYVEGESVSSIVRRGPVAPEQVVALGIQLASALEEAHSHGVIHRDLKPANVLVTRAGKPKILDFGLAKRPASGESAITAAGHVVGTPGYMSPEQMLGYGADPRSDIYSLGVLLFELLTGRWPFEAKGDRAPTLSSMKDRVPRAEEVQSGVGSDLSAVLARAMAWEPDERQQSASELGSELAQLTSGLSEQPTEVRFSEAAALQRKVKRPRWQWGVGLAVALFVAVLFGWQWVSDWVSSIDIGGVEGPPIVAVLPLDNVSGDPSIDHLGVGIAHTLVTKLSAIPSVTMVSRSATLDYVRQTGDTRELARDLGASFVVKGSVQSLGERLLLTVNLVRADDSVAWGGEYEGDLQDLFDLQRKLAGGLTGALQLTLSPDDVQRLEAPPTSNMDAFAEFSQGRDFLERTHVPENLDRAIALLESAVGKDPTFVLAQAALGEAYWNKFQQTTDSSWTEKARMAAEEARRLDPDHPAVRYALAVIYHGSGRVEEAVEELNRALVLQPNNDDVHALLGKILADQGRVDDAANEFRRAIEIRPNYSGHYRSLGLAYYNAGRLPEAADAFRRVTELQPDLPGGFQMLGATYHSMGDLDRAVSNYTKAIELGPSRASHSNLGTIYYRQGKFAEAVESYKEALKLNPNYPLTLRNLGDAYRRLGKMSEARESYLEAAEINRSLLEVNPKNARAKGMLAVLEAKLGRMGEAVRLAEEAVELAPQDPHVFHRKAVVHALGGDLDEAMDAIRLAAEKGYSVSEVAEDDDLVALRDLPSFKDLIEKK